MKSATKIVAAVAVGAICAASAVLANTGIDLERPKGAEFRHGHGISFDLGGKHAVGYFLSNSEACELTVVLADTNGGETAADSPGTRFGVPVQAGTSLRIDAAASKSVEFTCSDDALRMSTRVFDRAPYKS